MENELTLEECFDKIRSLVDYDLIENQKKYANHLFEIAKDNKNLKSWEKEYSKIYKEFTAEFKGDEEKLDKLLHTNYQAGYFQGQDRGLEMVAEGILKSLIKLNPKGK